MAAQLLVHCATASPEQPLSTSGLPTVVSVEPASQDLPMPTARPTPPETSTMAAAVCLVGRDAVAKPKAMDCTHASTVLAEVQPWAVSPPEASGIANVSNSDALSQPVAPSQSQGGQPWVSPVEPVVVPQRAPATQPNWEAMLAALPGAPQFSDTPVRVTASPNISHSNARQWEVRPASGSQLYQLRIASLRAGQLYTHTSPQSYASQWHSPATSASYAQWQSLLAQEAAAMAQAQGNNRLTVIVGDSLALWLPVEALPHDRFWLNQSISGETTRQILGRLHYFDATRPDTIHLMAGINDLKNGATDTEVVGNMRQILTRLRQRHPQARVMVYGILPTRWENLPSDRIRRVNHQIANVASQQGATFVDLQPVFADAQGQLRRELTTDGLHLSPQGYRLWQAAIVGEE
jgi:lysophospholipase L1-like esterase